MHIQTIQTLSKVKISVSDKTENPLAKIEIQLKEKFKEVFIKSVIKHPSDMPYSKFGNYKIYEIKFFHDLEYDVTDL